MRQQPTQLLLCSGISMILVLWACEPTKPPTPVAQVEDLPEDEAGANPDSGDPDGGGGGGGDVDLGSILSQLGALGGGGAAPDDPSVRALGGGPETTPGQVPPTAAENGMIADGDEADIRGSSSPSALYLTGLVNRFQAPTDFMCPGNSFLAGEKTDFDTDGESFDREHQLHCRFFEDGKGRPVVRTSCQKSAPIAPGAFGSTRYRCPENTYMAGHHSTYAADGDRRYAYTCCEMQTVGGRRVTTAQRPGLAEGDDQRPDCTTDAERVPSAFLELERFEPGISKPVNSDVNPRRGPGDFSCAHAGRLTPPQGTQANFQVEPLEDAVLVEVSSRWLPATKDRRFSYHCCRLRADAE